MATPIVTTSAKGVVKGFTEVEIVWGLAPSRFAIITPDGGGTDVAIEVGNSSSLAVGDRVSYSITDGPVGKLPYNLLKI